MDLFLDLDALKILDKPITLILSNGFEDRVPAGAIRLAERGIRFQHVLLVTYPGPEHENSYNVLRGAEHSLLGSASFVHVAPDPSEIMSLVEKLDPANDLILCDITGFSRRLIVRLLTLLYRRGFDMYCLYTEAKRYYPLKEDFGPFLKEKDTDKAFMKLVEYEEGDTVHSARCIVEEFDELPGEMIPSYPTLLVAFLSYKRSRLSSILNRYETNARVFISSTPVRRDLKWRVRALEIINFDLIADQDPILRHLPTLYWNKTYEFLETLYRNDNVGYKFNLLLAPLGGKMQTLGAWYFAIHHPDVKVVTSTPAKMFPERYSQGFLGTYLTKIGTPAVGPSERMNQ